MLSSLLLLAMLPNIELAKPFVAAAAGHTIEVDNGHAAPVFADFDGDGRKDLLVGQFEGGKMRIYRNLGTKRKPKFAGFTWFTAGGKVASVEFG